MTTSPSAAAGGGKFAPAAGPEREFVSAMKVVKEAIKLDSSGRPKEAYLQYLSCIQFISTTLLDDAKHKASSGKAMRSIPAQKMLRLAQQCTERSAALFECIDESETPVSLPQSLSPTIATTQATIPEVTSPPLPNSPSTSPQYDNIAQNTTQLNVPYAPVVATDLSPSSQPSFPQPPSTATSASVNTASSCYEFPPVPTTSPVRIPNDGSSATPHVQIPSASSSYPGAHVSPTSHGASGTSPVRKNQGSPLEVAYRENKKLMAAYRGRLARMHSKKSRAALSLTLQRRLMENMAIAKARESALAKKIEERQQRLQEEAARRFSSSGEPTAQELELRKLYASTLEFENQVNWLQEWRIKLQESPRDLQLIHELITHILACEEHPLTQQLQRYQFMVFKLIYPLIQKHSTKIQQNCVPYHDVKPLELSADAEPRVIPTDGFMAPLDPSKTIDDDLMKRLQALRESGAQYVRRSSAKSYASSTENDDEESLEESLEELLCGDVLVEDVILEEQDALVDNREECSNTDLDNSRTKEIADDDEIIDSSSSLSHAQNKELDNDMITDENEIVRDASLPTDAQNNKESNNSTERTNSENELAEETSLTFEDDNKDCNIENDECKETNLTCQDEDGNIDNVVDDMRAELEDAMEEREHLQHELEGQIRSDLAIGQGHDRLNEVKQEADDDIDRRSSADSGVQEDRTDGDESSETITPVLETKDRVPSDFIKEKEGDRVGENIEKDEDTDNIDKTEEEGTADVISNERIESEDSDGTRIQNGSDVIEQDLCNDDGNQDISEAEAEKDGKRCERNDEIVELTDGESKGDIDGGLDETEEERIKRLQEEALARHLKTISKDVLTYMDKVVSMLVAVYDELDNAVAREQCISVIEDHFFKTIWQPLLTLFRRVNVRKEATCATSMTKYQYAAPEHIGVTKKLCLVQPEGAIQDGGDDHYPYWQAVQELRKLAQYDSPLDKLECIVRSSRIIIQCVGDYYEKQGQPRQSLETAIGCDDLLPILSYVIIKSAMPQIVSECSAMEEFIHEGYLFGEEGYCLTTLMTALGYVLKLAND